MHASSRATSRIHFISLLLSYALITSLLAPFAIKRAEASAETDKGVKKSAPVIDSGNSELSVNSSTQGSEQRPGELLARFGGGVSEHDKATAVGPSLLR